MDGELISIIVPVYKVEKFLRKCVNSIINQSYEALEILLIDDGSPDNCPAICDELARLDSRIRVIHQQNGGLSVARNTGISHAKGDYIVFVDSDDYITPDAIFRLYGLIQKYDAEIAITDYWRESETGKRTAKKSRDIYTLVMDNPKGMEEFLYQRHFITSAWGKIISRSLLEGIWFPPGKLTEDMPVIYKLIDRASRIVYQSVPDYAYVQHSSSIVHSKKVERGLDLLMWTEEMYDFIEQKYPYLKKAAVSRSLSSNILFLMDIPIKDLYRSDHAAIVRANIKKYRKCVLCDPKARIKNRSCAFLSYFGIWVLKIALSVLS